MSLSVSGANEYFAEDKHLKSSSWNRYSEKQKAAAIAWAKGTINDALNGITLDTETTTEADFPRHDAAVYEQAIYTLEACKVLPMAASPTPQEMFPDKEKDVSGSVAVADPYALCKAAMMFLCRDAGKILLVRG